MALCIGGLMLTLMAACATSPSLPPTSRILGAIDLADGARIAPGTRITVRLIRAGETLDEVDVTPGRTPPPWSFELLYDRDQAGGVGAVEVEARQDGRVVLATLDPISVPLDGSLRTVAARLAPPRRAIGP